MKQQAFEELVDEAASCTRCPAMCGRSAVLSKLNGSTQARIMFVGEAPGAERR
jgi:uracil-DNA glycosylase